MHKFLWLNEKKLKIYSVTNCVFKNIDSWLANYQYSVNQHCFVCSNVVFLNPSKRVAHPFSIMLCKLFNIFIKILKFWTLGYISVVECLPQMSTPLGLIPSIAKIEKFWNFTKYFWNDLSIALFNSYLEFGDISKLIFIKSLTRNYSIEK